MLASAPSGGYSTGGSETSTTRIRLREVRRDVDEPTSVPWRGEEGDAVALPSYALRELREGEDVADGQPWHHHEVHAAAAGGVHGNEKQSLFKKNFEAF